MDRNDRQHHSNDGVRVFAVCDLDGLAGFETRWNDLVVSCPTATPMSSYPWLYSYFRHFVKAPTSWVCLFALRGDTLVGVLPLIRSGTSSAGTIRLPHNPHAISVDAVLAPETATEAFHALLDAARNQGGRTTAILFSRVRNDSPTLSLPTPTLFRSCQLAEEGAYLPVPEDFDEYRASLSRNFRNNLNKAANKLKRLPNVATLILAGSEADPELLPRFASVEAASWKGEVETAIQCSPLLLDFYRDLTHQLHRTGWLEWQFLETDGHPIAANLCIRLRRSLFVWKLGYDSEYSRCSPGSLLLEHVVRQASVDRAIDEIDLMTSQPWYNNWDMSWRPYNDFAAYWKGTLHGTASYCAIRLKDRLRQNPVLRRIKHRLQRGAA